MPRGKTELDPYADIITEQWHLDPVNAEPDHTGLTGLPRVWQATY